MRVIRWVGVGLVVAACGTTEVRVVPGECAADGGFPEAGQPADASTADGGGQVDGSHDGAASTDAASDASSDAGQDADADAGKDSVIQMSGSDWRTCALMKSGRVFCVGAQLLAEYGSLGDGLTTHGSTCDGLDCSKKYVRVLGIDDAVQVAAGGGHTCARRANGHVACWGLNNHGQIGDGTTTDRATPVEVLGLTDATQLAATGLATCALRQGGQVVCWGSNQFGEIGDGTAVDAVTPTDVGGVDNAVRVVAGSGHACAIRLGGQVVCWGADNYGQLGDNAAHVNCAVLTQCSRVAVDAVGVNDATAIAAGGPTTCAVRANGTVWCWGMNGNGELGDGVTAHPTKGPQCGWDDCSAVPVTVVGLASPVALELGSGHACAIKPGGQVACWGSNTWGALGNGGTNSEWSPVDATNLADAVSLSVGNAWHSCAIRNMGAVACWGRNNYSQVGDGTTTDRRAPTTIVVP